MRILLYLLYRSISYQTSSIHQSHLMKLMGWLSFSMALLGQSVFATALASEMEAFPSGDRDDSTQSHLTGELVTPSSTVPGQDVSSHVALSLAPLGPSNSPDSGESWSSLDREQPFTTEMPTKQLLKEGGVEDDAMSIELVPPSDADGIVHELRQDSEDSVLVGETAPATPNTSLPSTSLSQSHLEDITASEKTISAQMKPEQSVTSLGVFPSEGSQENDHPTLLSESSEATAVLAQSEVSSNEVPAETLEETSEEPLEEATDSLSEDTSKDAATTTGQFIVPPDEAETRTESEDSLSVSPADESLDLGEGAQLLEPIEGFRPLLQFQAASIYQDDELSGRLRATALYALNDQVLFGATVDLVGGSAFVDSTDEGLSLNELYVSAAPFRELPNLRFVGGLIDLTSYFDRNSFAKDVVTHFFNPVFQTNPALSAAGISSRPGVLVNWSATDQVDVKLAVFSSSRSLGDFSLDAAAAEVGFRSGNLIVRGTVTTARDAGSETGFEELFQIQRDDGSFGVLDGDREVAYGLNVEYFIDSVNIGLFGRYGWYENQDADRSGSTFSLGLNALDVFLEGDRLGLGYGQQLSNGDLRSGKTPDVWEIFYDASVYENVRAGISLQSREEFSDTFLGIRVRADW